MSTIFNNKRSVILFFFLLTIIVSCNNEIVSFNSETLSYKFTKNIKEIQHYWTLGEKRPLYTDSSRYFIVINLDRVSRESDTTILHRMIENKTLIPLCYDEQGAKKLLAQKSGTMQCIVHNNIVRKPYIEYKNHFYTDVKGNSIGMTNEILVKLKDSKGKSILYDVIDKYKLTLIDNPDTLWYILSCSSDELGTSIDIANKIFETGDFEEAYPNLLTQLEKCTVDTYYPNQWGLENSEYPGIDIGYVNAMAFPLPYQHAVTVAVVDDGITTTHPELNLSTYGYNAHLSQPYISVSPGIHGTKVAGIIGAKSNNYIGIAGVCPNVKLMSISFKFKSDYPNDYTSSLQVANGVKMAYENGASIINCSFTARQVDPYVFNEYNNAMNLGRSGRGCIVVFGAGNDNDEITNTYAINLPNAIVVGALNYKGEKSRISSFGDPLDIVAPGAAIWCTTVDGGYMSDAGTSLAAPYVSGVAALILSRNPLLTREQVVRIIYATAKRLPSYTFSTSPNRPYPWNKYVGHGLVNAEAALINTPTI